MPVTLTPASLIYPVGKLQRGWFNPTTADALETVVVEWLDLASAAVAALDDDDLEDAAARHYVYWRAYESIAQRIAGVPASEQSGGGNGFSRSWKVPEQIDYWQRLANAEKATFDALLAGETLAGRVTTVFTTAPGYRGR